MVVSLQKSENGFSTLSEFLFNIDNRKRMQSIKNKEQFEWVKVKTYLTVIDGQYAFETLKVYH